MKWEQGKYYGNWAFRNICYTPYAMVQENKPRIIKLVDFFGKGATDFNHHCNLNIAINSTYQRFIESNENEKWFITVETTDDFFYNTIIVFKDKEIMSLVLLCGIFED